MLVIHKPAIEQVEGGHVKLRAIFEVNGEPKDIWYSTSGEYAPYLCSERADAFILPLLFYAMQRDLPVKVDAPISERLYYAITNYLQPALTNVFREWHEVPVTCPVDPKPLPSVGAVGTGLSCGIDSFSTIADHLSDRQPQGFRLTHCTFFDVGGHSPLWSDADRTQQLFEQRAARARECANVLRLPLVVVGSNLEETMGTPFAATHSFRNVSAVLALQKLFKTYYYSSGHSAYDFKFGPVDSGDYDIFSMPLVSTETVNFFSTGALRTRVQKVETVSEFPPSYRFLNVCVFENANCSKCEKCLRTMLTLDILGKLQLYSDVFDLTLYHENKAWYVGHVLAGEERNPHYRELSDTMTKNGMSWGARFAYIWAWHGYRIMNKIKRTVGEVGDSWVF